MPFCPLPIRCPCPGSLTCPLLSHPSRLNQRPPSRRTPAWKGSLGPATQQGGPRARILLRSGSGTQGQGPRNCRDYRPELSRVWPPTHSTHSLHNSASTRLQAELQPRWPGTQALLLAPCSARSHLQKAAPLRPKGHPGCFCCKCSLPRL